MTWRHRVLRTHPAVMVLAGFLAAIALGAFLLELPISTNSGSISFVDAWFTATSAVCVTGLVVVDTGSYFSTFGQCVIIVLIQIGGLGVMTISVLLFQWVGRSISFRQRMLMQDLFAHTPREDILSLVRSVVFFTLSAEIAGTILLTFHWSSEFPLPQAIYTAIFHSISAFCNAGFSLFSDSLVRYSDRLVLNITMCSLIIVGGIGFPVLYDLQYCFFRQHKERKRLSIQTKVVLLTSLVLIIAGALMFALLERQTLWASSSIAHRILVPLFQSITCRTAGFNTVDISSLKEATLALMIFLMFFGASPGSCGGGVKTTTLALITSFTFTRILRKRRVNMFKKSIPPETVTRSFSLLLVSIGIICAVLFMLLIGDPTVYHNAPIQRGRFLTYVFETVSAFGTVGLSMGITPMLNIWDKYWIILMMILGRVGVLTFAYIIVGTGVTDAVEYSEENIMIG
jgi:trk system potassium uptake protein TrkH